MFIPRINILWAPALALFWPVLLASLLSASPLQGEPLEFPVENKLTVPSDPSTHGPQSAQEDFLTGLALEYQPDTSPNYPIIAQYYQSAAQGGSREALWALARLSGPHQPLDQGPEEWGKHLLAATQAGWPEAAYRLGEALEKNLVPAADRNPATYYLQAAMAGHGPAALRLGQMYLAGQSLPHDEAQGATWLVVAAENQVEEAALKLGELYYQKNPSLALQWLERTSSAQGAYLMGELYLKDRRALQAVSSFTSAADRNYPQAHLALGLLNLNNELGLRLNSRQALKHFKVAAQAGLPEGCYQLGQMYIKGQATPKDAITGSFWLHQAALGGHPTAGDELNKTRAQLSLGRQKRLERMIEDGFPLHANF